MNRLRMLQIPTDKLPENALTFRELCYSGLVLDQMIKGPPELRSVVPTLLIKEGVTRDEGSETIYYATRDIIGRMQRKRRQISNREKMKSVNDTLNDKKAQILRALDKWRTRSWFDVSHGPLGLESQRGGVRSETFSDPASG